MTAKNSRERREPGGLDQSRTGSFIYDVPTERWDWSPGVFHIYGFEAGDLVPTTELMRAHVHPDDEAHAFAIGVDALRSGDSFSSHFRIIDARRATRDVLAVGRAVQAEGRVVRLEGHLVDITEAGADQHALQVTDEVEEFKEHRVVIEQAKGALMQLFSIDADTAFLALRRMSQERNLKVRDLAVKVVAAASSDATPSKGDQRDIAEVLTEILG